MAQMKKKAFTMPKPVRITGRTSTITNSFVNGIIPVVMPSDAEVDKALSILGMNRNDVRCAYCGEMSTEWDHLRPIVQKERPTGFISEIANLVPACGKCNQSKSGHPWKEWINGPAPLSPHRRGIPDLPERIERLKNYESWRKPKVIDFASVVQPDLLAAHWKNLERLHALMRECQITSDKVRLSVDRAFRAQQDAPSDAAMPRL
jgi:hypothetical protein